MDTTMMCVSGVPRRSASCLVLEYECGAAARRGRSVCAGMQCVQKSEREKTNTTKESHLKQQPPTHGHTTTTPGTQSTAVYSYCTPPAHPAVWLRNAITHMRIPVMCTSMHSAISLCASSWPAYTRSPRVSVYIVCGKTSAVSPLTRAAVRVIRFLHLTINLSDRREQHRLVVSSARCQKLHSTKLGSGTTSVVC